jgi:hypothetical protein
MPAKIAPRIAENKVLHRKMSLSSKSLDTMKLASIMKDVESKEDKQPIIEVIRMKAKKFFVTSTFGYLYTNILLVLSVLSCLQYIIQTYFDDNDPKDQV